ncbi:hypothetical protein CWR43_29685 [Rhizobium sullae]|uniref:Uncharacterized protein n=2 Tax=Rhizobium sullae TaxID=50338 RepID=A0A2N0D1Z4_RHISU|nr:hypothetical protein CWR43_29685 [Rhizobium sullae]
MSQATKDGRSKDGVDRCLCADGRRKAKRGARPRRVISAKKHRGKSMTNIRFKGFDSPSQLREHLADVEEDASVADLAEDIPVDDDLQSAQREVAWLRKDVADLREQLALFRRRPKIVAVSRIGAYSWLRMAAAVLAVVALATWVRHLRHGRLGIRAAQMIPARADRNHW